MGLFNFIETFFFISLGITFILILLLVYHFKQRLSNLEQKNDSMVCIINNIVKEFTTIKQISNMILCNRSPPQNSFREKEKCEEVEDNEDEYTDDDTDGDEDGDEDEDEDEDEDDTVVDDIIKINKIDSIMSQPLIEISEVTEIPQVTEVSDVTETPELTEVNESIIFDDIEPLGKNDNVTNDETYKKMSIPELRNLVIVKGLTKDASKMKKPDLFKLLQLQL